VRSYLDYQQTPLEKNLFFPFFPQGRAGLYAIPVGPICEILWAIILGGLFSQTWNKKFFFIHPKRCSHCFWVGYICHIASWSATCIDPSKYIQAFTFSRLISCIISGNNITVFVKYEFHAYFTDTAAKTSKSLPSDWILTITP